MAARGPGGPDNRALRWGGCLVALASVLVAAQAVMVNVGTNMIAVDALRPWAWLVWTVIGLLAVLGVAVAVVLYRRDARGALIGVDSRARSLRPVARLEPAPPSSVPLDGDFPLGDVPTPGSSAAERPMRTPRIVSRRIRLYSDVVGRDLVELDLAVRRALDPGGIGKLEQLLPIHFAGSSNTFSAVFAPSTPNTSN